MKTTILTPLKGLALTFMLALGAHTAEAQGSFTVNAYVDANNNCVKDAGETPVNNVSLRLLDGSQSWGVAWGTTDCNGQAVLSYTTSPTNTLTVSNSGAYNMASYLSSCFTNSTNIANGSIVDMPFTTLPNTLQNDSVFIYVGSNLVFPPDTTFLCGSTANSMLYYSAHHYMGCNTSYTGNIDLYLDGVLYDHIPMSANIMTSVPFTGTNGSGFYQYGSSQSTSNQVSFYYDFNGLNLSLGLHKITMDADPFGSVTSNSTTDYYIYRDSCAQVTVYPYLDCNNNCVKDASEGSASNLVALTVTDGVHTFYSYGNGAGALNVYIPVSLSGTYSITPTLYYNNYSLCAGASFTANINATSNILHYVGVKETTTSQANRAIYHFFGGATSAVPGGNFNIYAHPYSWYMNSCAYVNGPGKVMIVLAPDISYIGSLGTTSAPDNIISAPTGDTLVWNVANVNALPYSYDINVFVSTTATIGNAYCITSILTPVNDQYPSDNYYTTCRLYGGPFDPNSKESVAPNMTANGDIPLNTQDLLYTINFQNLGNAPAINVTIKDTLDTDLDLSSLRIEQSSFPVSVQTNASSREITFRFHQINLPDATTNEPGSHGFVRFKVNLNSGLPVGTTIKNKGHIYFDFNTAIITNEVVNTLVIPTGINENSLEGVSVYPNPAKDVLHIHAAKALRSVSVTNLLGAEVIYQEANSADTTVQLDKLSNGVYLLKAVDMNGNTGTYKIIKQ